MATEAPLVSVLTPVFNGEPYLRECIESVLAQTHGNWDYTIVDNCSTDRTFDIAREYAARESRIRVHRNQDFVRVIRNHNIAFRLISPESKYCKVVAADDWLFPECLQRMVRVAEEHPSIGIVGAYGLDGVKVLWGGLPYPSTCVKGREVARAKLFGGPDVFGAPTSLLFRSDLVRTRPEFFNEENLHADTEACLEFLEGHDFGFVHQVLTFTRVQRDSLTAHSKKVNTYLPGNLYILLKHGPKHLSEAEMAFMVRRRLGKYYRHLGEQVFRLRGPEFWSFHRDKLAAMGHPLSTLRLVRAAVSYALDLLLNPKKTLEGAARRLGAWARSRGRVAGVDRPRARAG